jgi:heme/copper-type cytochrome/quinol oxidase subunit 3
MSGDNTMSDISVPDMTDRPLFKETPEEREFELRAAVGAYWSGGRLLIGMFTFLFASLAFAYFYLRSNNSGQLWRPGGITAPTGIGWAIFAVVLASALLAMYGNMRMRTGSVIDWEVSGWTAVLGGLVAIGLQIWQLTQLPFFPGSSGYASCFIGWAVMNIMLLASGVYWLETNLAVAIRTRRARAEEAASTSSPSPATQLFRANVEACTYFWGFMALVSTLFWVLFYLI